MAKKKWKQGGGAVPANPTTGTGGRATQTVAVIATGPAQEQHKSMLANILGWAATLVGHFSLPAAGESPFKTGYVMQIFSDEAQAISDKLKAADPTATHFDSNLSSVTPQQEATAASNAAKPGEIPLVSLSQ